MDIVALIISILAFLLSVIQFFRDNSSEKKQAKLNAYQDLQENALGDLATYPTPMPDIPWGSDEWKKVSGFLAALEWFSVGVNTGAFSLRVTNRIGGSFLIHQYEQLKKVIVKKRELNIAKGEHYNEFEQLVSKLKKHRARMERLKNWTSDFRRE